MPSASSSCVNPAFRRPDGHKGLLRSRAQGSVMQSNQFLQYARHSPTLPPECPVKAPLFHQCILWENLFLSFQDMGNYGTMTLFKAGNSRIAIRTMSVAVPSAVMAKSGPGVQAGNRQLGSPDLPDPPIVQGYGNDLQQHDQKGHRTNDHTRHHPRRLRPDSGNLRMCQRTDAPGRKPRPVGRQQALRGDSAKRYPAKAEPCDGRTGPDMRHLHFHYRRRPHLQNHPTRPVAG